jgi:hypothetical protein
MLQITVICYRSIHKNSQQLFCNFCRSVGHDERTCRSYELMMDRTPTYRVQAETRPLDQNAGMARQDFRGADEAEVEEDLEEVADN